MQWILYVIILLIGIFSGIGISMFIWKGIFERKLVAAKGSAESLVEEAKKEALTIRKKGEALAKEHWYKQKKKFERDFYRERKNLEKERKRLEEVEQQIEKKQEALQKKEREMKSLDRNLSERLRKQKNQEERLQKLISEETKRLEEVARLTKEEAKAELLRTIESQAKYEAAQLIYKIREEAKLKADREAKEIITQAIQRCAASHTADTTVSVVLLPSDDMKGRIIGREGRNIRAFEAVTGVEVIIDDTPEAVTLSAFDPLRREMARITLDRLIQDGRIHPTRIEEMYERVKEEFDSYIQGIGEETVLELGLSGFHPELLQYIGKMKFRTSYGQNLLIHSKEVARLATLMANELGLNPELSKRAGLLHDIGKLSDETYEGPHALVGAQIAKRLGESDIVVNAIAAHHEDVEPKSPIAVLIAAADAISGSRPGARRESLEAYIKRIEKLEEIASHYMGVNKAYAIQAGRELRIIVEADKISDVEAFELARTIAKRIEGELEYPGQIKVTVVRETRAIEYAR